VRDFQTAKLKEHLGVLDQLASQAIANHPGARYEIKQREQYRNMKEVLDQHPQVAAFAEEAIRRAGMEVRKLPIRGGTDGSRLSFMGMPCPNIFTGEMSFHSKHEYVSVQDMQKAVETIVHLAAIWEEKS
jgi:tripeptide aminopeptidase